MPKLYTCPFLAALYEVPGFYLATSNSELKLYKPGGGDPIKEKDD